MVVYPVIYEQSPPISSLQPQVTSLPLTPQSTLRLTVCSHPLPTLTALKLKLPRPEAPLLHKTEDPWSSPNVVEGLPCLRIQWILMKSVCSPEYN